MKSARHQDSAPPPSPTTAAHTPPTGWAPSARVERARKWADCHEDIIQSSSQQKSIKVAHCQEADLGDWLQQAPHSSLTRCFVIFPGLKSDLYPRRRGLTNTNTDNNINTYTDTDGADISSWRLQEWPEDMILHYYLIHFGFNLIFIKIDTFSYQVKVVTNSTGALLSSEMIRNDSTGNTGQKAWGAVGMLEFNSRAGWVLTEAGVWGRGGGLPARFHPFPLAQSRPLIV